MTSAPLLTQPVRTALIGFGFAGQTFHAPLLLSTPGLELIAIGSSRPDAVARLLGAPAGGGTASASANASASTVTVHAQPQDIFDRPDIELVVIATPNDSHAPLAEAALRAGKAVVVDKPFTLDAGQAQALVDLAAQQQCLLSVFHNRRWDGDFLTAQDLLESGALGRVTHAALHFERFRPQVRARWRESATPGGGVFIDLMPHLMDQALVLFGEPEAVSADIAALRDGAAGDDFAQVSLRYASGLRVHLQASMLAAQPGPRFALQGTRGAWRKWGLDCQEDDLRAGLRPDTVPAGTWGDDPQAGELRVAADAQRPDELVSQTWPNLPGDYSAYYAGIVAALRGQGPNPVPAEEGLRVMRWLDLAREAARLGRCLTR